MPDDWRHPLSPQLLQQEIGQVPQEGQREDKNLASIYHPVEHDDQKRFNKELASFYNAIRWNVEILSCLLKCTMMLVNDGVG